VRILGIVAETHDAGVALLEDGIPVAIIEEERLNRQKHTRKFPTLALEEIFGAAGRSFADIDVITTPWDMRRLRRTVLRAVLGHLPASLSLVLPATQTTQDRGIVLLNFWLRYYLKRQFHGQRLPEIVNVGHHESHAAIFFAHPLRRPAFSSSMAMATTPRPVLSRAPAMSLSGSGMASSSTASA
jgi:carbamoyltransferase